MDKKKIKIEGYTDGSCIPNPGVGGWGWVLFLTINNSVPLEFNGCGGLSKSTNNQMELQGMINFLRECTKYPNSHVNVFCDSMYVIGGIIGQLPKDQSQTTKKENKVVKVDKIPQGWLKGWVNVRVYNNPYGDYSDDYWRNSATPAVNKEEWYNIHVLLLRLFDLGIEISIGHVKAHSGIYGNEIADVLAKKYSKIQK